MGGNFEGAPLLLLHSIGAKSGEARVSPMMYLPDGDRFLVFASKTGAPDNPDWYHNLKANPDATIEVDDDTFDVRADELPRAERHESTPSRPRSSRLRRLREEDRPGDPGARSHAALRLVGTETVGSRVNGV